MSYEAYNWRDLVGKSGSLSKVIHCTNSEEPTGIYLNIEGSKESVLLANSGKSLGVRYVLDIRPLVVLTNCLPVPVFFAVGGNTEDEVTFKDLNPGESAHLPQIRFGFTWMHLKIFGFRDSDWICSQLIENELHDAISHWKFRSVHAGIQAKFHLDINCVKSRGTYVWSIYAPFWMINKTVSQYKNYILLY